MTSQDLPLQTKERGCRRGRPLVTLLMTTVYRYGCRRGRPLVTLLARGEMRQGPHLQMRNGHDTPPTLPAALQLDFLRAWAAATGERERPALRVDAAS